MYNNQENKQEKEKEAEEEDIDEDKVEEETPFERTLLGDIKRRRAIFDAALIDCSLAHPPENIKAIRMFYRGEIATCHMFEAENVAVEYNIKFPPGWTLEDNSIELSGCSFKFGIGALDSIGKGTFSIGPIVTGTVLINDISSM